MPRIPRVAFFADSFHEMNGAAHTCRLLQDFAVRRGYPFLAVHCGPKTAYREQGEFRQQELRRSILAWRVDTDLSFDFLFQRYAGAVEERLRVFHPDVIHLTSPGDAGILGAYLAHRLKVPLSISWHTNLHEFAARRLERMFGWLPGGTAHKISGAAERFILERVLWFYSRAALALAPNLELVEMIHAASHKPVYLMERGVDTEFFTPERRQRRDDAFVLGFVGRVKPEKNVRLLVRIEQSLLARGLHNFRIQVVGHGDEVPYLRANLRHGEFTGHLKGEALAQAYANMDLFVFPSRTDTYGNVVQEALASGVPAVVTSSGGPKFLLDHGVNGYVAETDEDFIELTRCIVESPALHARLRAAARPAALSRSWDSVFENVYAAWNTFVIDS